MTDDDYCNMVYRRALSYLLNCAWDDCKLGLFDVGSAFKEMCEVLK